jgi:hypothetical protein
MVLKTLQFRRNAHMSLSNSPSLESWFRDGLGLMPELAYRAIFVARALSSCQGPLSGVDYASVFVRAMDEIHDENADFCDARVLRLFIESTAGELRGDVTCLGMVDRFYSCIVSAPPVSGCDGSDFLRRILITSATFLSNLADWACGFYKETVLHALGNRAPFRYFDFYLRSCFLPYDFCSGPDGCQNVERLISVLAFRICAYLVTHEIICGMERLKLERSDVAGFCAIIDILVAIKSVESGLPVVSLRSHAENNSLMYRDAVMSSLGVRLEVLPMSVCPGDWHFTPQLRGFLDSIFANPLDLLKYCVPYRCHVYNLLVNVVPAVRGVIESRRDVIFSHSYSVEFRDFAFSLCRFNYDRYSHGGVGDGGVYKAWKRTYSRGFPFVSLTQSASGVSRGDAEMRQASSAAAGGSRMGQKGGGQGLDRSRELAICKAECTRLRSELDGARQEIADLGVTLANRSDKFLKAEADCRELQRAFDDAKAEIDRHKAESDRRSQVQSNAEERCQELQRELNKANAKIAEHEAESDRRSQVQSNAEERCQELERELNKANAKIAEHEAESDRRSQVQSNAEERCQELRSELDKANAKIAEHEAVSGRDYQRLSDAEKKCLRLKEQADDATRDLGERNDELVRVRATFEDLGARYAEEKRISSLRELVVSGMAERLKASVLGGPGDAPGVGSPAASVSGTPGGAAEAEQPAASALDVPDGGQPAASVSGTPGGAAEAEQPAASALDVPDGGQPAASVLNTPGGAAEAEPPAASALDIPDGGQPAASVLNTPGGAAEAEPPAASALDIPDGGQPATSVLNTPGGAAEAEQPAASALTTGGAAGIADGAEPSSVASKRKRTADAAGRAGHSSDDSNRKKANASELGLMRRRWNTMPYGCCTEIIFQSFMGRPSGCEPESGSSTSGVAS